MDADKHNLILGLAIIGVLGTFTRKSTPAANVERAETVNQGQQA